MAGGGTNPKIINVIIVIFLFHGSVHTKQFIYWLIRGELTSFPNIWSDIKATRGSGVRTNGQKRTFNQKDFLIFTASTRGIECWRWFSVLGWNESVITDGWRFEQSEHADLRLIWSLMRPSFVKGNCGVSIQYIMAFVKQKKEQIVQKCSRLFTFINFQLQLKQLMTCFPV